MMADPTSWSSTGSLLYARRSATTISNPKPSRRRIPAAPIGTAGSTPVEERTLEELAGTTVTASGATTGATTVTAMTDAEGNRAAVCPLNAVGVALIAKLDALHVAGDDVRTAEGDVRDVGILGVRTSTLGGEGDARKAEPGESSASKKR